jgi:hypothetical protein
MTGYEVDTDAMRHHARRLGQLKSDLDEAVDAGASSTISVGAFGLLCGFLEPPAMLMQSVCTTAIAGVSGVMDGAAFAITTAANGYDALDESLNGEVSKLLSELDSGGGR